MFDAYRRVLTVPGASAFTLAGSLLRLPLAVYPVAVVLFVSLGTGDYGRGGLLTASYIVGGVVGNPVLSRIADRAGQRAVLLPAAIVHVLALFALVVSVRTGAPIVVQVFTAAAVGVSFVPVGALVRARWVSALRGSSAALGTALSLESTLDEVTFVVGPLLATALAIGVDGAAPFVLSACLVVAGATILHLLRAGTPVPRQPAAHGRQPLPGLIVGIVATMAAIGVNLVSIDLAAIAFVGQASQDGWTGAVLACFALGSGIAGFAYGLKAWRRPVERRLPVVAVVFAVLPVLLLAVTNVATLAGLLFVVGLGTAPLLTTMFGTLERITPPARLTEGLAWVTTGRSLGAGVAAPVVGWVADAAGARMALLLPLAASLTAGALALLTASRVTRRVTSTATPLPAAEDGDLDPRP